MIHPSEQPLSRSQIPTPWRPEVIEAFADLCQSEQLNPVRFRKLIDSYVATQRKPSRQELIEALKHRPKINERAAILSSITKKLTTFMERLVQAD